MKSCSQCLSSFEVIDADRQFYQKMDVPEPTWCPRCRHMRRHGHINDYAFYRRPCDRCGQDFVSTLPKESDYVIYCQSCWCAEDRDCRAPGRAYDFNRSFFSQFDALMHAAPQLGIVGTGNENCDYCESTAHCRNCYLISESSNCEDSFFCYWIQKSKDCIDCSYLHECERCYEANHCFNCYRLHFSRNCSNCSDSWFLDQCVDCDHCLFSANLRNKQFYIFNKPYSKDAYFQELEKLKFGSHDVIQMLKKQFHVFLKHSPVNICKSKMPKAVAAIIFGMPRIAARYFIATMPRTALTANMSGAAPKIATIRIRRGVMPPCFMKPLTRGLSLTTSSFRVIAGVRTTWSTAIPVNNATIVSVVSDSKEINIVF
ncbi:hypothetical protein HZA43_04200 [Candidatus Peregrinibacteria bacterium]|nr:hypothetical protein [Candidatus Peregrinibacteria bacterium]